MPSPKPELILNEQFMIDIFKKYLEELPPFQEYLDEMFNNKKMSVVARRSGSKVMQLAEVKKSLFKPSRKTDKQAKKRLLLFAQIATKTILTEIDDKKRPHTNTQRLRSLSTRGQNFRSRQN